MALASTKVFSLQGKSLKLDSRSDIEPYLKDVDPTVIEEIHLGGNTIGVGAASALAEFLEKATALKVRRGIYNLFQKNSEADLHEDRSQILQISLPAVLSLKYLPRCPRSATPSKTSPLSSNST